MHLCKTWHLLVSLRVVFSLFFDSLLASSNPFSFEVLWRCSWSHTKSSTSCGQKEPDWKVPQSLQPRPRPQRLPPIISRTIFGRQWISFQRRVIFLFSSQAASRVVPPCSQHPHHPHVSLSQLASCTRRGGVLHCNLLVVTVNSLFLPLSLSSPCRPRLARVFSLSTTDCNPQPLSHFFLPFASLFSHCRSFAFSPLRCCVLFSCLFTIWRDTQQNLRQHVGAQARNLLSLSMSLSFSKDNNE